MLHHITRKLQKDVKSLKTTTVIVISDNGISLLKWLGLGATVEVIV